MPAQVGSRAISAVHWVTASTKTRSKNSSMGLTISPWRKVTAVRDRLAAGALTGPFWTAAADCGGFGSGPPGGNGVDEPLDGHGAGVVLGVRPVVLLLAVALVEVG